MQLVDLIVFLNFVCYIFFSPKALSCLSMARIFSFSSGIFSVLEVIFVSFLLRLFYCAYCVSPSAGLPCFIFAVAVFVFVLVPFIFFFFPVLAPLNVVVRSIMVISRLFFCDVLKDVC